MMFVVQYCFDEDLPPAHRVFESRAEAEPFVADCFARVASGDLISCELFGVKRTASSGDAIEAVIEGRAVMLEHNRQARSQMALAKLGRIIKKLAFKERNSPQT